ncbi:hypothetical protein GCM10023176_47050 [Micromonospora coerulea]|uniref:Uncharacterized protein n=1 Tax=Micromonospora coerulea TaxID=47856 RepID=A0ABP8SUV9_9ACTN
MARAIIAAWSVGSAERRDTASTNRGNRTSPSCRRRPRGPEQVTRLPRVGDGKQATAGGVAAAELLRVAAGPLACTR